MIELRVLQPDHPSSDDIVAFIRLNAEFNDSVLTPEQVVENLRVAKERVILAELDGRVCGFVCVQVWMQVCYVTPTAEVTELYVEPNARRRGVARALMQRAEAMAHDVGADVIRVATGFHNDEAQQLYYGLGYRNNDIVLEKSLSEVIEREK